MVRYDLNDKIEFGLDNGHFGETFRKMVYMGS